MPLAKQCLQLDVIALSASILQFLVVTPLSPMAMYTAHLMKSSFHIWAGNGFYQLLRRVASAVCFLLHLLALSCFSIGLSGSPWQTVDDEPLVCHAIKQHTHSTCNHTQAITDFNDLTCCLFLYLIIFMKSLKWQEHGQNGGTKPSICLLFHMLHILFTEHLSSTRSHEYSTVC